MISKIDDRRDGNVEVSETTLINIEHSNSKETEESKEEIKMNPYLEQGRATNYLPRSSSETENEDNERSNVEMIKKILGGN